MSTNQLFISLAGLLITLLAMITTFFKWYLDARFGTIDSQLKFLVDHCFDHAERIATLEAKVSK